MRWLEVLAASSGLAQVWFLGVSAVYWLARLGRSAGIGGQASFYLKSLCQWPPLLKAPVLFYLNTFCQRSTLLEVPVPFDLKLYAGG